MYFLTGKVGSKARCWVCMERLPLATRNLKGTRSSSNSVLTNTEAWNSPSSTPDTSPIL